MSAKPEYQVVSPVGKPVAEMIPLSPALSSLEGKTIGFEWNGFTNGPVLADALADLLGKQFKGLKFVKLPPAKGRPWGEGSFDTSVGTVAKEAGVDAIIALVGG